MTSYSKSLEFTVSDTGEINLANELPNFSFPTEGKPYVAEISAKVIFVDKSSLPNYLYVQFITNNNSEELADATEKNTIHKDKIIDSDTATGKYYLKKDTYVSAYPDTFPSSNGDFITFRCKITRSDKTSAVDDNIDKIEITMKITFANDIYNYVTHGVQRKGLGFSKFNYTSTGMLHKNIPIPDTIESGDWFDVWLDLQYTDLAVNVTKNSEDDTVVNDYKTKVILLSQTRALTDDENHVTSTGDYIYYRTDIGLAFCDQHELQMNTSSVNEKVKLSCKKLQNHTHLHVDLVTNTVKQYLTTLTIQYDKSILENNYDLTHVDEKYLYTNYGGAIHQNEGYHFQPHIGFPRLKVNFSKAKVGIVGSKVFPNNYIMNVMKSSFNQLDTHTISKNVHGYNAPNENVDGEANTNSYYVDSQGQPDYGVKVIKTPNDYTFRNVDSAITEDIVLTYNISCKKVMNTGLFITQYNTNDISVEHRIPTIYGVDLNPWAEIEDQHVYETRLIFQDPGYIFGDRSDLKIDNYGDFTTTKVLEGIIQDKVIETRTAWSFRTKFTGELVSISEAGSSMKYMLVDNINPYKFRTFYRTTGMAYGGFWNNYNIFYKDKKGYHTINLTYPDNEPEEVQLVEITRQEDMRAYYEIQNNSLTVSVPQSLTIENMHDFSITLSSDKEIREIHCKFKQNGQEILIPEYDIILESPFSTSVTQQLNLSYSYPEIKPTNEFSDGQDGNLVIEVYTVDDRGIESIVANGNIIVVTYLNNITLESYSLKPNETFDAEPRKMELEYSDFMKNIFYMTGTFNAIIVLNSIHTMSNNVKFQTNKLTIRLDYIYTNRNDEVVTIYLGQVLRSFDSYGISKIYVSFTINKESLSTTNDTSKIKLTITTDNTDVKIQFAYIQDNIIPLYNLYEFDSNSKPIQFPYKNISILPPTIEYTLNNTSSVKIGTFTYPSDTKAFPIGYELPCNLYIMFNSITLNTNYRFKIKDISNFNSSFFANSPNNTTRLIAYNANFRDIRIMHQRTPFDITMDFFDSNDLSTTILSGSMQINHFQIGINNIPENEKTVKPVLSSVTCVTNGGLIGLNNASNVEFEITGVTTPGWIIIMINGTKFHDHGYSSTPGVQHTFGANYMIPGDTVTLGIDISGYLDGKYNVEISQKSGFGVDSDTTTIQIDKYVIQPNINLTNITLKDNFISTYNYESFTIENINNDIYSDHSQYKKQLYLHHDVAGKHNPIEFIDTLKKNPNGTERVYPGFPLIVNWLKGALTTEVDRFTHDRTVTFRYKIIDKYLNESAVKDLITIPFNTIIPDSKFKISDYYYNNSKVLVVDKIEPVKIQDTNGQNTISNSRINYELKLYQADADHVTPRADWEWPSSARILTVNPYVSNEIPKFRLVVTDQYLNSNITTVDGFTINDSIFEHQSNVDRYSLTNLSLDDALISKPNTITLTNNYDSSSNNVLGTHIFKYGVQSNDVTHDIHRKVEVVDRYPPDIYINGNPTEYTMSINSTNRDEEFERVVSGSHSFTNGDFVVPYTKVSNNQSDGTIFTLSFTASNLLSNKYLRIGSYSATEFVVTDTNGIDVNPQTRFTVEFYIGHIKHSFFSFTGNGGAGNIDLNDLTYYSSIINHDNVGQDKLIVAIPDNVNSVVFKFSSTGTNRWTGFGYDVVKVDNDLVSANKLFTNDYGSLNNITIKIDDAVDGIQIIDFPLRCNVTKTELQNTNLYYLNYTDLPVTYSNFDTDYFKLNDLTKGDYKSIHRFYDSSSNSIVLDETITIRDKPQPTNYGVEITHANNTLEFSTSNMQLGDYIILSNESLSSIEQLTTDRITSTGQESGHIFFTLSTFEGYGMNEYSVVMRDKFSNDGSKVKLPHIEYPLIYSNLLVEHRSNVDRYGFVNNLYSNVIVSYATDGWSNIVTTGLDSNDITYEGLVTYEASNATSKTTIHRKVEVVDRHPPDIKYLVPSTIKVSTFSDYISEINYAVSKVPLSDVGVNMSTVDSEYSAKYGNITQIQNYVGLYPSTQPSIDQQNINFAISSGYVLRIAKAQNINEGIDMYNQTFKFDFGSGNNFQFSDHGASISGSITYEQVNVRVDPYKYGTRPMYFVKIPDGITSVQLNFIEKGNFTWTGFGYDIIQLKEQLDEQFSEQDLESLEIQHDNDYASLSNLLIKVDDAVDGIQHINFPFRCNLEKTPLQNTNLFYSNYTDLPVTYSNFTDSNFIFNDITKGNFKSTHIFYDSSGNSIVLDETIDILAKPPPTNYGVHIVHDSNENKLKFKTSNMQLGDYIILSNESLSTIQPLANDRITTIDQESGHIFFTSNDFLGYGMNEYSIDMRDKFGTYGGVIQLPCIKYEESYCNLLVEHRSNVDRYGFVNNLYSNVEISNDTGSNINIEGIDSNDITCKGRVTYEASNATSKTTIHREVEVVDRYPPDMYISMQPKISRDQELEQVLSGDVTLKDVYTYTKVLDSAPRAFPLSFTNLYSNKYLRIGSAQVDSFSESISQSKGIDVNWGIKYTVKFYENQSEQSSFTFHGNYSGGISFGDTYPNPYKILKINNGQTPLIVAIPDNVNRIVFEFISNGGSWSGFGYDVVEVAVTPTTFLEIQHSNDYASLSNLLIKVDDAVDGIQHIDFPFRCNLEKTPLQNTNLFYSNYTDLPVTYSNFIGSYFKLNDETLGDTYTSTHTFFDSSGNVSTLEETITIRDKPRPSNYGVHIVHDSNENKLKFKTSNMQLGDYIILSNESLSTTQSLVNDRITTTDQESGYIFFTSNDFLGYGMNEYSIDMRDKFGTYGGVIQLPCIKYAESYCNLLVEHRSNVDRYGIVNNLYSNVEISNDTGSNINIEGLDSNDITYKGLVTYEVSNATSKTTIHRKVEVVDRYPPEIYHESRFHTKYFRDWSIKHQFIIPTNGNTISNFSCIFKLNNITEHSTQNYYWDIGASHIVGQEGGFQMSALTKNIDSEKMLSIFINYSNSADTYIDYLQVTELKYIKININVEELNITVSISHSNTLHGEYVNKQTHNLTLGTTRIAYDYLFIGRSGYLFQDRFANDDLEIYEFLVNFGAVTYNQDNSYIYEKGSASDYDEKIIMYNNEFFFKQVLNSGIIKTKTKVDISPIFNEFKLNHMYLTLNETLLKIYDAVDGVYYLNLDSLNIATSNTYTNVQNDRIQYKYESNNDLLDYRNVLFDIENTKTNPESVVPAQPTLTNINVNNNYNEKLFIKDGSDNIVKLNLSNQFLTLDDDLSIQYTHSNLIVYLQQSNNQNDIKSLSNLTYDIFKSREHIDGIIFSNIYRDVYNENLQNNGYLNTVNSLTVEYTLHSNIITSDQPSIQSSDSNVIHNNLSYKTGDFKYSINTKITDIRNYTSNTTMNIYFSPSNYTTITNTDYLLSNSDNIFQTDTFKLQFSNYNQSLYDNSKYFVDVSYSNVLDNVPTSNTHIQLRGKTTITEGNKLTIQNLLSVNDTFKDSVVEGKYNIGYELDGFQIIGNENTSHDDFRIIYNDKEPRPNYVFKNDVYFSNVNIENKDDSNLLYQYNKFDFITDFQINMSNYSQYDKYTQIRSNIFVKKDNEIDELYLPFGSATAFSDGLSNIQKYVVKYEIITTDVGTKKDFTFNFNRIPYGYKVYNEEKDTTPGFSIFESGSLLKLNVGLTDGSVDKLLCSYNRSKFDIVPLVKVDNYDNNVYNFVDRHGKDYNAISLKVNDKYLHYDSNTSELSFKNSSLIMSSDTEKSNCTFPIYSCNNYDYLIKTIDDRYYLSNDQDFQTVELHHNTWSTYNILSNVNERLYNSNNISFSVNNPDANVKNKLMILIEKKQIDDIETKQYKLFASNIEITTSLGDRNVFDYDEKYKILVLDSSNITEGNYGAHNIQLHLGEYVSVIDDINKITPDFVSPDDISQGTLKVFKNDSRSKRLYNNSKIDAGNLYVVDSYTTQMSNMSQLIIKQDNENSKAELKYSLENFYENNENDYYVQLSDRFKSGKINMNLIQYNIAHESNILPLELDVDKENLIICKVQ